MVILNVRIPPLVMFDLFISVTVPVDVVAVIGWNCDVSPLTIILSISLGSPSFDTLILQTTVSIIQLP